MRGDAYDEHAVARERRQRRDRAQRIMSDLNEYVERERRRGKFNKPQRGGVREWIPTEDQNAEEAR